MPVEDPPLKGWNIEDPRLEEWDLLLYG